jgi:hypothetical protein
MSLTKEQWDLFYTLGRKMEAYLAAIRKYQDLYDRLNVLQRLEEGKDRSTLKEGFAKEEALELKEFWDNSQRYRKNMQLAHENYLKSVLREKVNSDSDD